MTGFRPPHESILQLAANVLNVPAYTGKRLGCLLVPEGKGPELAPEGVILINAVHRETIAAALMLFAQDAAMGQNLSIPLTEPAEKLK